MEALTRHSAEPCALAEAISSATHMARMPSAALLDDIAPLLSLVRLLKPFGESLEAFAQLEPFTAVSSVSHS